ncbi:hypothetical protein V501_03589 [Pseudogymnoascus sp. VKM F-4519 (FW-2642)]|nr:hypothetical protein V501_03589 [Pseudogymnoascus sp. VKM F-4519 (FW-2642)]
MGYWPPVAGAVPFYAFSNPAGGQGQAQSPGQQGNQQPPIYNRALYAPQPPQSNYPPRQQSSDESIPPHQQQQQQYSMSLPYPSSSSASDQQQQQQSVQQQQAPQQHDAYGPRPPPTPTYAFPPTTAHPFPSYTQPSPPPARLSPTTTTGAGGAGPYRPFPYALPTLSGAVMSNVHSPGSQLSLLSAPPGHGMSQQQQHHVKGCGKPARPTSTSHHQSSSISAPSTQRRYTTNDIKTEGTLSSDAESPGGRRGSDE